MQDYNQPENSVDLLDSYEKRKIFAFKGLISSFIAWQLGQIIVSNFSEWLPVWFMSVLQIIILFGALGWVGFIFYLIKIGQFVKKDSLILNQVNDERMSLIRLRAMSYGFMITLGATSLFLAAAILFDSFTVKFDLSGVFVAQSLILVAVSSAFISFLVLDR